MQILKGHISPESAWIVENYPYGFRLRCTMRYWLETHPKKGVRMFSQTSNPKKAGQPWNKPKASTYSLFGAAMYLDAENHVQHTGLTEYTTGAEAKAWMDTFGEGCPDAARKTMMGWVAAKVAFDAARDAGQDNRAAAAAANAARSQSDLGVEDTDARMAVA